MKAIAALLPPDIAARVMRARALPDDEVVEPVSCPRCDDAGFVRRVRTVGDEGFGAFEPCRCTLEREQRERSARLLRYSTLDCPLLAAMTFAAFRQRPNLKPEGAAFLEKAVRAARAYARDPRGFLTFFGRYGCGKTHLAAAIAHEQIAAGRVAIFATVPDILDHLRAAYNESGAGGYDELFGRWRSVPLLVLDDLGAERSTEWAAEKLYQLIDHRYRDRLPTVITTNAKADQMDGRIVDRIRDVDNGQVVELVNVPSYRTPEGKAQR